MGGKLARMALARMTAPSTRPPHATPARGSSNSSLVRLTFERLHVPAPDFQAPAPEDLLRAVEFVQTRIDSDTDPRSVYVHCNAGKGRSAAVVAAYLMHAGLVDVSTGTDVPTVAQVVEEMKQARPQVVYRNVSSLCCHDCNA